MVERGPILNKVIKVFSTSYDGQDDTEVEIHHGLGKHHSAIESTEALAQ
jgi:hypothetical protein